MNRKTISLFALILIALPLSGVFAATAARENAGKLADGSEIWAVTLTGGNGVSARILSTAPPFNR